MSKTTDQPDQDRRAFIGKAAGAVAAATLAPGVFLHMTADAAYRQEPVTSKVRYGMLIDTQRCADGCTACVDACNHENGMDQLVKPEGLSEEHWDQVIPKWIRKVKVEDRVTGQVTTLPMLCQHCESPPCEDVCPTGASFRRADGIVMVDRHICIGCRYCMMACPYKARSFIHEVVEHKPTVAPRGRGCVESCNFCVQRRDSGGTTTACQDACTREGHNAIVFGDLNDPSSEVSQALRKYPSRQIRADLKLNTGVRYSGV